MKENVKDVSQKTIEETKEVKQEEVLKSKEEVVEEVKEEVKDEQVDIDEVVKKAITDNKRQLAKRLGINIFDEEEIDKFVEEREELKQKAESISQLEKEKELAVKKLSVENELLKSNVRKDRIGLAKSLVNSKLDSGMSVEEAVKSVIEEVPEWKQDSKITFGAKTDNTTELKSGFDKFIEKEKKKLGL